MTSSTRLASLRFRLEQLYREQASARVKPAPPQHALLPLPLPERLVLLARIDGATPREVKEILGVSEEDAALESPRMVEALRLMRLSLLDPHRFLPEALTQETHGYAWADHHGHDLERHLRQRLFASTAVCLFGEAVPSAVAGLNLRSRLVLYGLLVEELSWAEVEALLGCSEHAIRSAINQAVERLEPASTLKENNDSVEHVLNCRGK